MPRNFYLFIILCALILAPGCKKKGYNLHELKKRHREIHQKRINEQRPFKNKKIEKLTFEEAQQVYNYYQRGHKDLQLIMTLERMLSLSSDHTVVEPLLKQAADLYFEQGNYKKAEELYASYSQLYPGSEAIDYVQKQEIEASNNQRSIAQRDQTKTKKTIALAKNFLSTFPSTNKYYTRVHEIMIDCYFIIMESELNKIRFYINRYYLLEQPKALEAAWQRLADMNRDVLANIDDQSIRVLQEKIRKVLDQPTEQRTIEQLEKLVADIHNNIPQKTFVTWLIS